MTRSGFRATVAICGGVMALALAGCSKEPTGDPAVAANAGTAATEADKKAATGAAPTMNPNASGADSLIGSKGK